MSNLLMSPEKIASEWRQAKDKTKQIRILAELNLCPEAEIVAILKTQGVDGRQLPRKYQKPPHRDAPLPSENPESADEPPMQPQADPDPEYTFISKRQEECDLLRLESKLLREENERLWTLILCGHGGKDES